MKLFVVFAFVAIVGYSLCELTPAEKETKTVLLTKGKELVKQADEAITKLQSENKAQEVAIIRSEEAKIKKLVADLEAATDDAKMKAIGAELFTEEFKLQFVLQKISHPSF